MQREAVEQRFRERVAEFRKNYYWFIAGAIVISLAIAVGVGVVFYIALGYGWLFFSKSLPPRWAAISLYIFLFLTIGYAQYRRKLAVSEDADKLFGLETNTPGLEMILLGGVNTAFNLLHLLFSFPGLIFQFVEELFQGRHLFTSEEVERLAFQVLVDGGEKVSAEFLQTKLHENPEGLRRALQLLLEMRLLLLKSRGRGRTLLRSLDAMELLAAKPAAPGNPD